jgi:hypothetical protein
VARHIRFTRSQIQRARRLLHMKYKPSEVAEELGCSVEFIRRVCIPAGCPYERHENGYYYWIVGDRFRDWMLAMQREAVAEGRAKLGEGQGYCVVCERATDLRDVFEVRPIDGHLELAKGYCSHCGAVVTKGRRRRSQ